MNVKGSVFLFAHICVKLAPIYCAIKVFLTSFTQHYEAMLSVYTLCVRLQEGKLCFHC